VYVLEDRHMERIPESVADAIHDVVNALQVAVLLAAQIDRRMSGLQDSDQAELRRAIHRAVTALAPLKPTPRTDD